MELRRITMVNWHLFDVEDIELRGDAGVLGENRSGKSTILDMIQVVMTGASSRFYHLNAVAGDGKKKRGNKSRRTVRDYCLGALGEDERRRTETITYLALGFADPDEELPPITIGLALEARETDPSEFVLGRYVAVGTLLTSADFTEQREDGLYVMEWSDVKEGIEEKVGPERFHNHHDSVMHYVREYMRHVLPGAPTDEKHARSLLKAVVNAAALDQGYSATEFVRNFILEDNRIEVAGLRESINTYREVSNTIADMRRRLEALKALKVHVDRFEGNLNKAAVEKWIATRAAYLSSLAENRSLHRKVALARDAIEAENRKRGELRRKNTELQDEISRLHGDLIAHQERSGRRGAQESLNAVRDREEGALKSARRRRQGAVGLRSVLPMLEESGMADVSGLKAFLDLAASEDTTASRLRDAEERFLADAERIGKHLGALHQSTSARAGNLREEASGLRQALGRDDGQGLRAYLNPSTMELMRRLESSGMRPRPLCDLIEINDPEWVAAAEALLGRDREAVLVDRRDIHAATAILKDGRRELRGASLVSLNKIEPFRGEAPKPGTFPCLFDTDDADAMAFIMRRHGNVRLAGTMEEFNLPGRALMNDGLYDDGLVRQNRRLDLGDHKIGRKAQAALVEEKRRSLASKEREADELEKQAILLGHCMQSIRVLTGEEDGETLAASLEKLADLSARKAELESLIQAIDAEDDGGLQEAHDALVDEKTELEKELEALSGVVNEHEKAKAIAEHMLGEGDKNHGSNLNLLIARNAYAGERRMQALNDAIATYRERLERLSILADDGDRTDVEWLHAVAEAHGAISKQASESRDKAEKAMWKADNVIRLAIKDYAQDFGESMPIGPDSHIMEEVKPWMNGQIAHIEGNVLTKYEKDAKEAAERSARLFRGEFVNALSGRIAKMERELDDLNRGLRAHPFHNEYYSFRRTKVANYDPILKAVEVSRQSDDALDSLFKADAAEDSPYGDIVREVEKILQDDGIDVGAFEDYRDFYTFEIHMEDKDTGRTTKWETRRETGSGAEQQVPLYVAIGASLATVYGSSARKPGGRHGISLAMFDEAFSTMDENNKRAMITFYSNLGLQILIAAPMMNRSDLIGYVETVVEVDRIDDQAQTTVTYHKKRARDEVVAINPQRLSDDEVKHRMKAEGAAEAAAD